MLRNESLRDTEGVDPNIVRRLLPRDEAFAAKGSDGVPVALTDRPLELDRSFKKIAPVRFSPGRSSARAIAFPSIVVCIPLVAEAKTGRA